MLIIHELDSIPSSLRGGAVSIGKFDGMHLGHSLIVHRLKSHAGKFQAPAVVLTFDPPPIAILRPDLGIRPICTLERKIELLRRFHIDALIVLRTDENLLRQSAEDFFFQTLRDRLRAKIVVEGKNFTFGRDRGGNSETIRCFGERTGIDVDIVEPLRLGEVIVSSSEIRRLLKEGKIEQVNELMPLPFRLTGTVSDGEHRGRTLGFPTANLDGVQTIIPKPGVYASVVHLDDRRYSATTHLGENPTFGEHLSKVEIFIHDFSDNIYGRRLDVDLLAYLREIVRFRSKDELVRQMELDVRQSRDISTAFVKGTIELIAPEGISTEGLNCQTS